MKSSSTKPITIRHSWSDSISTSGYRQAIKYPKYCKELGVEKMFLCLKAWAEQESNPNSQKWLERLRALGQNESNKTDKFSDAPNLGLLYNPVEVTEKEEYFFFHTKGLRNPQGEYTFTEEEAERIYSFIQNEQHTSLSLEDLARSI